MKQRKSGLFVPEDTPEQTPVPAGLDPKKSPLWKYMDLRRFKAPGGELDEEATLRAQEAFTARSEARWTAKHGTLHACTVPVLNRFGQIVEGCGKHLKALTGPNHETRRRIARFMEANARANRKLQSKASATLRGISDRLVSKDVGVDPVPVDAGV